MARKDPRAPSIALANPLPLFPTFQTQALEWFGAQESVVCLPLATRGQMILMDFPDEFGVGGIGLSSRLTSSSLSLAPPSVLLLPQ